MVACYIVNATTQNSSFHFHALGVAPFVIYAPR